MRDLYSNIIAFHTYWKDAPMVQDTFDAFEKSFSEGFDGTVCASKAIVECACKTIVEEFDNPENPIKSHPNSPIKANNPSVTNWMSAATQLLNLVDERNDPFNGIISQYNSLLRTLGKFRNEAGNISHGRMGFVKKLSEYHRRSVVVIADSIIAFLHGAYLDQATNPASTFEPYERFSLFNGNIDAGCDFKDTEIDESGVLHVTVRVGSRDNEMKFSVEVSRFLFGIDRDAYREAQLATADRKATEE